MFKKEPNKKNKARAAAADAGAPGPAAQEEDTAAAAAAPVVDAAAPGAVVPGAVAEEEESAAAAAAEENAAAKAKEAEMVKMQEAALKIQKVRRGAAERKRVRETQEQRREAAVRIQKIRRGQAARAERRRGESAAGKIQSTSKGTAAQKPPQAPQAPAPQQPRRAARRSKPGSIGAPVPKGINDRSGIDLTRELDLEVAFQMLDRTGAGEMDGPEAKCWLRCAGWALPEAELEDMLKDAWDSSPAASKDPGGTSRGRGKPRNYDFEQLTAICEQGRDKDNQSLEALQAAIRRLAGDKPRIRRARLDEVATRRRDFQRPDLEDILQSIGLAGTDPLNCDALAFALLDSLCRPPSVTELPLLSPRPSGEKNVGKKAGHGR